MDKMSNIVFTIAEVLLLIGLLMKVMFGDAGVVDYIGLAGVGLVGISSIGSLFSNKKEADV